MSVDTTVLAAIDYARHGWHVFPCTPGGKTPLTTHGCLDASVDLGTVAGWWMRWPDANVAIRTGEISDLFVLDIDSGHGGDEAVGFLQRLHGGLADPAWVATGGGGWHCYYAYPPGGPWPNTAGRLGAGLDTRGDNGYVVAPPSVHPSGVVYRWHEDPSPSQPPAWLLRLLRPPPSPVAVARDLADVDAYAAAALTSEATQVAAAPAGVRNDSLNRAAFNCGQLAGAGLLTASQITDALLGAARTCGLPDAEARRTINSGLGAGAANPRQVRR